MTGMDFGVMFAMAWGLPAFIKLNACATEANGSVTPIPIDAGIRAELSANNISLVLFSLPATA